jgi:mannose-6-phosphate isomerase
MWRVRGVLRAYDWGPVDGLVPWCAPTGGPQAELWFGVHPSAPAPLVDDSGDDTGGTLADVLPPQRRALLVKLLAAARPLSIQVHPAAEQAAALHALGHLPDDQAKVEALTALTTFRLFAGWRDADVARVIWSSAGVPDDVVALLPDRPAALRAAFALPAQVVARAVPQVAGAAESAGVGAAAVAALRQVAALYPADPGVLVCALMEYSVLDAGGAVGVLPGVIHSYVEGVGVEVMTSSDNVLRLGLTTKPLALEAALAALDVDLSPCPASDERLPFDVRLVEAGLALAPHGFRVILCLEGSIEVACGPARRMAPAGEAIVLAEQDPAAEVLVRGRAALVAAR